MRKEEEAEILRKAGGRRAWIPRTLSRGVVPLSELARSVQRTVLGSDVPVIRGTKGTVIEPQLLQERIVQSFVHQASPSGRKAQALKVDRLIHQSAVLSGSLVAPSSPIEQLKTKRRTTTESCV